ncbi:glycosyltransferase family 4 protein [Salana multivorans]
MPRPVTSVALDLLTLVPGGMGGTETYARELITHLAKDDTLRLSAVLSRSARGFTQGRIRETVIESVPGGASTRERLETVGRAMLARRRVLAAVRNADVVHFPFTAEIPPMPRGTRVVQTLHDLQHLDLPELFPRAELVYRRWSYERAARRAAAVVTISEFSRERIVEHLGIPAERIHVVPLGVDTSDFTPNLGPREEFVLFPARGWPHKNHALLIEAMRLLRQERPGLRLVLTGGALDSLGDLPEWVDVRGLVPLAELRELYRTAAVMAFPSRYEGFGLPPLEAMASGCPVAASRAGSLPEVCGDAAEYFDPSDAAEAATAIAAAIDETPRLQRLGLERAAAFSWERCATATAEVYRRVADTTGS